MKGAPVFLRLLAKNSRSRKVVMGLGEEGGTGGDRTGWDCSNWRETNSWGSFCVFEGGSTRCSCTLSFRLKIPLKLLHCLFLPLAHIRSRKGSNGSLKASAVKNERMCNMRQGNSCMMGGGGDGWG